MTRDITLAEYFWLAEQVTGVDADTLSKVSRMELAESALHAPQASFGGEEFYPDVVDHPLLDGNKRAAWASLVLFVDLNGGSWDPDPPDVDEAEAAMVAVAAHQVDEDWFGEWLRRRTQLRSPRTATSRGLSSQDRSKSPVQGP